MSRAQQLAAWVLRAIVMVVLVAGALALARISLQRNVERACELDEWPHLSSCPKPDTARAAQLADLRQRVARNPGDAANYLALALLTQSGSIAPLDEEAVLRVTRELAPQDPVLHRVLAARALQRGQMPEAVHWLVRLVEGARDERAAQALAALLAFPEGRAALVAALQPGSRWLEPLLRALPAAGVSIQQALPLLEPALALKLMTSSQGLALVSQLKAQGAWLEAQALWLRLLGRPAPQIFNGGFEQGFIRGGFDWELPDAPASRAGVQVQQPALPGAQGRVLELTFSGRPVTLPVIGQHLVLFPGGYVFQGRFMARRLRAGAGLGWIFTCTAGGAELARTPPLLDTQGRWQEISVPMDVPSGCGAVALQLRTQLGSDALAGVQGDAYFDDFQLALR
jgi:hypothetical protein